MRRSGRSGQRRVAALAIALALLAAAALAGCPARRPGAGAPPLDPTFLDRA